MSSASETSVSYFSLVTQTVYNVLYYSILTLTMGMFLHVFFGDRGKKATPKDQDKKKETVSQHKIVEESKADATAESIGLSTDTSAVQTKSTSSSEITSTTATRISIVHQSSGQTTVDEVATRSHTTPVPVESKSAVEVSSIDSNTGVVHQEPDIQSIVPFIDENGPQDNNSVHIDTNQRSKSSVLAEMDELSLSSANLHAHNALTANSLHDSPVKILMNEIPRNSPDEWVVVSENSSNASTGSVISHEDSVSPSTMISSDPSVSEGINHQTRIINTSSNTKTDSEGDCHHADEVVHVAPTRTFSRRLSSSSIQVSSLDEEPAMHSTQHHEFDEHESPPLKASTEVEGSVMKSSLEAVGATSIAIEAVESAKQTPAAAKTEDNRDDHHEVVHIAPTRTFSRRLSSSSIKVSSLADDEPANHSTQHHEFHEHESPPLKASEMSSIKSETAPASTLAEAVDQNTIGSKARNTEEEVSNTSIEVKKVERVGEESKGHTQNDSSQMVSTNAKAAKIEEDNQDGHHEVVHVAPTRSFSRRLSSSSIKVSSHVDDESAMHSTQHHEFDEHESPPLKVPETDSTIKAEVIEDTIKAENVKKEEEMSTKTTIQRKSSILLAQASIFQSTTNINDPKDNDSSIKPTASTASSKVTKLVSKLAAKPSGVEISPIKSKTTNPAASPSSPSPAPEVSPIKAQEPVPASPDPMATQSDEKLNASATATVTSSDNTIEQISDPSMSSKSVKTVKVTRIVTQGKGNSITTINPETESSLSMDDKSVKVVSTTETIEPGQNADGQQVTRKIIKKVILKTVTKPKASLETSESVKVSSSETSPMATASHETNTFESTSISTKGTKENDSEGVISAKIDEIAVKTDSEATSSVSEADKQPIIADEPANTPQTEGTTSNESGNGLDDLQNEISGMRRLAARSQSPIRPTEIVLQSSRPSKRLMSPLRSMSPSQRQRHTTPPNPNDTALSITAANTLANASSRLQDGRPNTNDSNANEIITSDDITSNESDGDKLKISSDRKPGIIPSTGSSKSNRLSGMERRGSTTNINTISASADPKVEEARAAAKARVAAKAKLKAQEEAEVAAKARAEAEALAIAEAEAKERDAKRSAEGLKATAARLKAKLAAEKEFSPNISHASGSSSPRSQSPRSLSPRNGNPENQSQSVMMPPDIVSFPKNDSIASPTPVIASTKISEGNTVISQENSSVTAPPTTVAPVATSPVRNISPRALVKSAAITSSSTAIPASNTRNISPRGTIRSSITSPSTSNIAPATASASSTGSSVRNTSPRSATKPSTSVKVSTASNASTETTISPTNSTGSSSSATSATSSATSSRNISPRLKKSTVTSAASITATESSTSTRNISPRLTKSNSITSKTPLPVEQRNISPRAPLKSASNRVSPSTSSTTSTGSTSGSNKFRTTTKLTKSYGTSSSSTTNTSNSMNSQANDIKNDSHHEINLDTSIDSLLYASTYSNTDKNSSSMILPHQSPQNDRFDDEESQRDYPNELSNELSPSKRRVSFRVSGGIADIREYEIESSSDEYEEYSEDDEYDILDMPHDDMNAHSDMETSLREETIPRNQVDDLLN